MDASPLNGVGGTSLGVARARAWESRRPDRLFDDPYAAEFVAAGGSGGRAPLSPARARLAFHVIIRTRFYDDFLLAACDSGCRQVVLPAAGLDTRAYRLPWPPAVTLYELDLPEVLAFKDRVLAGAGAEPRCARTAVPVDLREDWPRRLTDAGFDASAPTAWLVEGLLVYLSPEDADRVLSRVGALSAPGSRISLERNNAASVIAEEDRGGIEEYADLWQGGVGDTAGRLAGDGWQTEVHELADVAASYGRPAPSSSLSGFLTATR
ncbi:SAM-dependent methyltransferase [Actinoallomurus sp. CA-142502]|uniref:SAM-dependent methyltransferase n=1 Tax=Actinoallomurus sp. CA-142502 TaxID=3239885 RepID=UPI003D912CA3